MLSTFFFSNFRGHDPLLQAIRRRTWSRAPDREAARQPQEVDDTRAEAAGGGERERDDAMREGWRLGAHFNNPP